MSLEELRKKYPAPFALSVLRRAIEIDQDDPDVAKALREYAKGKESCSTPVEFYYVLKLVDNLRMVKLATQIPSGENLIRRLAWQALTDDVDELSFCEAVAKTGQNIKIYPIKKIDISGNVNGYLQKENYLVIVGLEVRPKVADTEAFSEVINTLGKNAISAYMQYMYKKEKGGKVPVTFEEFFLNMRIQFYDSLMERPIYSFQTKMHTMADYLRITLKMLGKDKIELVQLQVVNLTFL